MLDECLATLDNVHGPCHPLEPNHFRKVQSPFLLLPLPSPTRQHAFQPSPQRRDTCRYQVVRSASSCSSFPDSTNTSPWFNTSLLDGLISNSPARRRIIGVSPYLLRSSN